MRQIGSEIIWENGTSHYLGMTIDYDLKFGKYFLKALNES